MVCWKRTKIKKRPKKSSLVDSIEKFIRAMSYEPGKNLWVQRKVTKTRKTKWDRKRSVKTIYWDKASWKQIQSWSDKTFFDIMGRERTKRETKDRSSYFRSIWE